MGEFLRKYVSRRLSTVSEGKIAALTKSMRQLGAGSQGGAGGLDHFRHKKHGSRRGAHNTESQHQHTKGFGSNTCVFFSDFLGCPYVLTLPHVFF